MKTLTFKIILFTIICYASLYSQWSNDPYLNTRVSNWGVRPMTVQDGNGGSYISFSNFSYDSSHSYLQRIRFDGTISWEEPVQINYEGNKSGTFGMILTDDDFKELIVGYRAGISYRDSNHIE